MSSENLADIRQRIDRLDDEIIDRLGARFRLVHEVTERKKTGAIPVMQPGRVEAVKTRCRQRGEPLGLSATFVDQLYDLIIAEACRMEYAAIGDDDQASAAT